MPSERIENLRSSSGAGQESKGVVAVGSRDSRYQLRPGDRWYVAMTLPRKERVAAANLDNQDFPSFLPMQLVTHRHARRFRTQLVPVFPRYIFAILNIDTQRWRSVNGTLGIARLVTDGEKPLAVAPGIVETLIQSSDQRGALVFQPDLAIGDRVRLLAGPFAESFGVLERLDGADRVQLMLDLIGGSMKVSAPRDMVLHSGRSEMTDSPEWR
jgi:transcription elongation factor/antiterminator RfaH